MSCTSPSLAPSLPCVARAFRTLTEERAFQPLIAGGQSDIVGLFAVCGIVVAAFAVTAGAFLAAL